MRFFVAALLHRLNKFNRNLSLTDKVIDRVNSSISVHFIKQKHSWTTNMSDHRAKLMKLNKEIRSEQRKQNDDRKCVWTPVRRMTRRRKSLSSSNNHRRNSIFHENENEKSFRSLKRNLQRKNVFVRRSKNSWRKKIDSGFFCSIVEFWVRRKSARNRKKKRSLDERRIDRLDKEKNFRVFDISMRKSSNIGRARPSTISFYSTVFDSGSDEHRLRWKNEIFQILERNDTKKSLFYRLVVFSLTLTSLVAGAISTIDFFKPTAARFLFVFETFLLLFFLVELILRAFSCRTSIRFDSILLILFSVILFNARKTFRLSELSLKVLPPLQMIRFLRVDRRMTSWKILKGILFIHRQELTVTFVIAFMFLITASYLIQIAETPINLNEKSGPFRSVADTIWFSIITVWNRKFSSLSSTDRDKMKRSCL